MKGQKVMHSHQSDLWTTPQDLFDQLNLEFKFNLDATATADNTKCSRYITPQMDALSCDWTGNVWVNPPYSQCADFVAKACAEVEANHAAVVVMLLPCRTDTRWFHRFVYGKHEIRLIKGRLKFGDGKNPAPFPSLLVIFRRPLEP